MRYTIYWGSIAPILDREARSSDGRTCLLPDQSGSDLSGEGIVQGSPLPGAWVSLYGPARIFQTAAMTDEQGQARLSIYQSPPKGRDLF